MYRLTFYSTWLKKRDFNEESKVKVENLRNDVNNLDSQKLKNVDKTVQNETGTVDLS